MTITKRIFPAIMLLLTCAFANAQQQLFTTGWQFHKGDILNGENNTSDTIAWNAVSLPNDWSIEGPFSTDWASATGYLPAGIGWYKKTFTAQLSWQSKNIFIYFDGIYKNSTVWLNGHYLGNRPNGFIAFEYELTKYLDFKGPNTLTVKVDHHDFADSRWYTGSGIYRNVYLNVKNPVHIANWGVQFTTPDINKQNANVNTKVTVVNAGMQSTPVTVLAVLKDNKGNIVAKASEQIKVNKADSTVANLSLVVKNPLLWSVDNPNLYTLFVSLISNGKSIGQYTTRTGIRKIKFDADKGFFLNDKNLKLKGVCIHDDAGALGVAVPKEVWIRRLRTLKEGGCNSIRMGHNPHADYLYDLCDDLGFLVMDEAFDEWETGKNKWIKGWNKGEPGKDGYSKYFKEWADKDLRDMILRSYNHPSIIMWSIGNEIDYPNDPYSHEILNAGNNPQIYGKGYLPDHPPAARLGEISQQLVQVAKTYDTSRPITAALAGVTMSNFTSYPGNLDIVGYNYQEYRYGEDHKNYPNRIIYGSENGMSDNAWKAVDTNNYISAQYLWTGIDYMGEAGVFPNRSNTAGLINLGGFPKPEYYFRQSLWSAKPMVYIGTSPITTNGKSNIWSHKRVSPVWDEKSGDSIRVSCFTNCKEAELFLNNRSLGKKLLSGAKGDVLHWDIVYQAGGLTVKGFNNGQQVAIYNLSTAGPTTQVTAHVYKDVLINEHTGLKQIEVALSDSKGQLVYSANNEITVTINGDAKLLGIESGDPSSIEAYTSNKRKAMHGTLIIYVKPGIKNLPFTVKITSPGLQPAALNFN
ncbi:MAG: sugar-binding domain-containing protein [Ferruginibacter sp.]